MNHRIKALLAGCLFLAPLSAQTALQGTLDSLLRHPLLRTSEVGLTVYDLTADRPLYRYRDEKRARPASVQKVMTSVAALATLGTQHAFTTYIYKEGTMDADTLHGRLTIVGDMDPLFSLTDLREMTQTVRRRGIQAVRGEVVGDVSLKDSVYWGTGWSWDDAPYSFQPYLSPLMLNEGCVEVTVRPGQRDSVATVEVTPSSSFYQVVNRTVSGRPSAGSLSIERDWMTKGRTILVTGNVEKTVKKTLTMGPSDEFFLRVLGEEWNSSVDNILFGLTSNPPARQLVGKTRWVFRQPNGSNPENQTNGIINRIEPCGQETMRPTEDPAGLPYKLASRPNGSNPENQTNGSLQLDKGENEDTNITPDTLATLSRPLTEVLTRALKKSDNLCAEAMFFHLAKGTASRPLHWEDAAEALTRFAADSLGIDRGLHTVVDGSGVSLYDYTTPAILLEYLKLAYHRPQWFRTFYQALPVAGVDGTLAGRMKGTRAAGNVHAKTGSVTGISTLAGYVTAANGHLLAFVIMNQNVGTLKEARNWQDKVCEALAK
jgi:D-alanyl-D-alanine carboxypeptidase/D-alanyl-D-alanine-endopeptidase (penicillin-binding protein 4)